MGMGQTGLPDTCGETEFVSLFLGRSSRVDRVSAGLTIACVDRVFPE